MFSKKLFLYCFFFIISSSAIAQEKILNVYAWSGEVPDSIIRKFEKETGIRVNFSTYENNEIMYAKLRTNKNAGYDIIFPYSSFVDRMRKQNMLEPLDKSKLSNLKNINPVFLNPSFDPGLKYSIPFIWGVTGIAFNDKYYAASQITQWTNLWEKRFENKLLALDDIREIFAVALITLGYSINDSNPQHIEEAFLKLKGLMPNIKVFSTDTLISILIDEDATIGIVWNGDAFKAAQENPHIKFVYPKEGFQIWVDNFAIPKNAPHKEAAYAFINFVLRPDIAKEVALYSGYPIANSAGQHLLPSAIQNNPIAYPPQDILKRGQFVTDVSNDALGMYEKYWEELKMNS